jgi:DNA-directed RNA polymerase subunit M/transcription elongation factor TFIIS
LHKLSARKRDELPQFRVSNFEIRVSDFYHGLPPAFHLRMENKGSAVVSPNDITFACSNCASALVVDAAAAGMILDCQRCGKPTPVPMISPTKGAVVANNSAVADLQRRLKENESQRTEITAYINQHSIQLHRWQLRLQTLNERKKELEEELRNTRG